MTNPDAKSGHDELREMLAKATPAERVARYVQMRDEKPLRGMDDDIHGLHSGTEWEAALSLSDLRALLDERDRLAGEVERLSALSRPQPEPVTFQARVHDWIIACFGAEIGADVIERNHRFLEEGLELVQANGCTASEAHQLVDYVFGRPVGEPHQEVGGVMNTLAALCTAAGLDMAGAGEVELSRVWTKVEQIRAKQAAKPKHSPLPMAAPEPAPPQPQPDVGRLGAVASGSMPRRSPCRLPNPRNRQ
jgi:hypothetical protein